ncbi:hypothetical protein [Arthrobacter sp. ISL-65]|uniref:hypothetical protein n=1 Tax=Arthrobacter sp. ISL-65 TaxID=2819112 RepID=UPI001BEAAC14|nr:hypothetical protein [Arthrobacter sp. ISL-65]MBT2549606.1 hypothetical protein [Arthrobacter sp. ISL-65]
MIILCSVFVAVQICLGLLSLDLVTAAWPVLLAMPIYVAAVAVVLFPRPGRLPRGPAIAALAAAAAITVLVSSVLPWDICPGYAAWHLSASYTLLVVVNIRGRVLLSWIGVVLSALLVTVWTSGTTMGLVGGLMLNIATVGWVLVSTGIGHLLRMNDRKVAQYSSDARAAADWHAAEQALNVARTQWLEHVRMVAGPALAPISDPAHTVTEEERRELQLIEARFRDEIRGRVLATEEVLEAARRARERGVTVQILDDSPRDFEPRTLAAVSQKVASVLDEARTGTVTARARPQGGRLAVTIVASSAEAPDGPMLVEFPER